MPRDFDRPRRVLLEWDARTSPVFAENARDTPLVPGDRGKVGAITGGPLAFLAPTAGQGQAGSPVLLRPDTDGVACLAFDAIASAGAFADQLTVSKTPRRITKRLTFAALVKIDAFNVVGSGLPTFIGGATTTTGAANVGFRNTSNVNFYVRDLTGQRNVPTGNGGTLLGAGWKRLIGTYDGTWVRAWVDGVALTPGRAEGYSFTIDSLNVFNQQTSGKLAYVLVTDYALGFGEVEALDARMAAIVSGATAETFPAPSTAPASLPALDSLYDSTQSVATSGSNVTAWDSASGATALQLTVPAGGYASPTVQTEAGVQVVEFGIGNAAIGANLGASRTVTGMTVHVVGRMLTQTAPVRAVSHGSNRAAPNLTLVGGNSSTATDAVQWTGIGAPTSLANHSPRDGKWHVWSYAYDGTGRLVMSYIDGAETGPYPGATDLNVQAFAASASFTQSGLWLGATATSGSGSQTGMRVAGVAHHTAALTPYQVRQFARWVRTESQWKDLFTGWDTDPLVVWAGSSNLITGSGTNEDIPTLSLNDAGNTKYERMYSLAQSGSMSQYMVYRVEREVAKLCDGVSGTKVVCMYAGGNDLVNNSLANVQTQVAACSSHLRATISGVKIVIGTQLPRTGVNDTDRATYNAWLLANTGAGLNLADAIADMASDPTVGGNGQNVMPNYSDGVHLTTAGTVIVVPHWVSAIQGLLP